jgi:16S rRNA (guanine966-N2)-methyltransferase
MAKVREALFSMLEARGLCWVETAVLDLFAGSGSLAFEALSRGAARVMLVESSKDAVDIIWKNATRLEVAPGRLHVATEAVSRFLARPGGSARGYDLVFVDPPYADRIVEQTLKLLIKQQWLSAEAIVVAEVETRARFNAALAPTELTLDTDRNYGQTRVLLWKNTLKK